MPKFVHLNFDKVNWNQRKKAINKVNWNYNGYLNFDLSFLHCNIK